MRILAVFMAAVFLGLIPVRSESQPPRGGLRGLASKIRSGLHIGRKLGQGGKGARVRGGRGGHAKATSGGQRGRRVARVHAGAGKRSGGGRKMRRASYKNYATAGVKKAQAAVSQARRAPAGKGGRSVVKEGASVQSADAAKQDARSALKSEILTRTPGAALDGTLLDRLTADLATAMSRGRLSASDRASLMEGVGQALKTETSEREQGVSRVRSLLSTGGVDAAGVERVLRDLQALQGHR